MRKYHPRGAARHSSTLSAESAIEVQLILHFFEPSARCPHDVLKLLMRYVTEEGNDR